MKIKNILIGTAVAGLGIALISCDLEKYENYSLQITETTIASGSSAFLSTSTLSETGVVSGESCDLTITPQFASGSTWINCTGTTTNPGTNFGSGTSGITTNAITGCAGLTSGSSGRFNVEYSQCDAGTSGFTKPTSEFTFT